MKLNKEQNKIVNSEAKNILVIACPGSGKTFTIIKRYIHLVTKKGVNPNNIILITFTKKAGMELKERINNYIPDKLPFYVGTLHSLAYKILKDNGCTNTILDDELNKEFISDIVDELEPLYSKKDKLKNNLSLIFDKLYFNFDIDPNDILNKTDFNKEKDMIIKLFEEYKKRKIEQNLFSFSDLMMEFYKFLNSDKGTKIKEQIDYVFFDEYQDINKLQEKILYTFNDNSNIMVVGDVCQSIYSFRGSDISYISNFKNKYKSKIFKLTTNYRSTKNIVEFNKNILEHPHYSMNFNKKNKKGAKPKIKKCVDSNHVIDFIKKDIQKKIKKNNCKYSDFAILSRRRTHNNINKFDEIKNSFAKVGIPALEKSNLSLLLEKSHINLFIALVIVKNNYKSKIHWKKILSCIPDIDVNLILGHDDILKYLETSEYSFIYKFMNLIDNEINLENKIELYLKLFCLLMHGNSKINDYIKDIKNLLSLIDGSNMTLLEYINEFYLSFEENIGNNVSLDTIHGSKGLEWMFVYIIDCNDSEYRPFDKPYYTKDDIIQLELEEHRLLYVGCTRAKRKLMIMYTKRLTEFIK